MESELCFLVGVEPDIKKKKKKKDKDREKEREKVRGRITLLSGVNVPIFCKERRITRDICYPA